MKPSVHIPWDIHAVVEEQQEIAERLRQQELAWSRYYERMFTSPDKIEAWLNAPS